MKTKKEVMKDLTKVRRRKIILQKKEIKTDEYGNQIEEWTDWKTIWAEKNGLWGQEYYAAKTVNEESTLKFTVRYAKYIDVINSVDYRVHYNNKAYDIKNIDYLRDDDMWVTIKALETDIDENS